jgi:transcription elongation factor Elf1
VDAKCPKCRTVGVVPERLIGKRVECSSCGYEFEVLAPTSVEQVYRYKMVQIPPNVRVEQGATTKGRAAAYLEEVVNDEAADGWEFYRVDAIGVVVPPGCLAGLFGARSTQITYSVITFRRRA